MGRKNIFELLANSNSIERDAARLDALFDSRRFVFFRRTPYTLRGFVDLYCFSSWPNRGRCLNVEDLLESLDLSGGFEECVVDIDSFLLSIEIVYNLWFLATNYLAQSKEERKTYETVNILKEFMDECLSEYNYKAFYYKDSEKCIVAEDSPQVTAAAEVTDTDTSIQIVRYNHYSMKGDISGKRAILLLLADYLEGRRTEICRINNALYKTISGALNNLNIRHNNIDPGNRHTYNRLVAEMPPKELEELYDELYQLILLAILEMDNTDRQRKIKDIVQRITSED